MVGAGRPRGKTDGSFRPRRCRRTCRPPYIGEMEMTSSTMATTGAHPNDTSARRPSNARFKASWAYRAASDWCRRGTRRAPRSPSPGRQRRACGLRRSRRSCRCPSSRTARYPGSSNRAHPLTITRSSSAALRAADASLIPSSSEDVSQWPSSSRIASGSWGTAERARRDRWSHHRGAPAEPQARRRWHQRHHLARCHHRLPRSQRAGSRRRCG